jgi:bisphosphoglycerate-independent phosphoglycerate mutase (AlkP superfamily)
MESYITLDSAKRRSRISVHAFGEGSLRDLSPTLLGIIGLEQPKEMTGKDLRVKKS